MPALFTCHLCDAANRFTARAITFHDFNIQLRSTARYHQRWLSFVSLDPVTALTDVVTLLCALSFVIFGVYSLALWIFGSVRTGMSAFYLLIAAALIHLAVSVCNVALVYDHYMGIRLLGHTGWTIFYYVFVCIQPIESLLAAVGLTMLVIWITRRV